MPTKILSVDETMITSSFGGLIDDSGSVLRFGLIDIKPVEVVETIKRCGVKFQRTTRYFESLKPSQSYEDFVTLINKVIFTKIDVPSKFEVDQLVKLSTQKSVMRYESDTELKNAIEELRNSSKIGRPLLNFTLFVKNRFETKREVYLESEAMRFLNSNFPLSFFNKFVIFDNTFFDFLKVLEKIVRWYELRATTSRNFRMYSKQISEMKKILSPLIDQIDRCLFDVSCLKNYILVWNSDSYEEILEEPKFLDFGKINPSKFNELSNEFETRLTEIRGLLLEFDTQIFQKEPRLENEFTEKMFAKLTMMPSEDLSL